MTLLSIAQNVAFSVGLTRPDQIVGSTEREHQEMLRFITETCQDMTRRVAWGELTKSTALTGDGTFKKHILPVDYDRLSDGACIISGYGPVRPLSQSEWPAITPVEGLPRYFLLQGDTIQFFPYLANQAPLNVYYQTKHFINGGLSHFGSDGDTLLIDERLVELGTTARWKRQKGQSYQDFEAEYEAALQQRAGYDDRSR